MTIHIERVYEFQKHDKPKDAYVVLIDKLWPRGISKERLELDEWAKQLAPSTELRKWFAHDETKWTEFIRRYEEELKPQNDELQRLKKISQQKQLVLLYGAKDTRHNQAVVLKQLLLHH